MNATFERRYPTPQAHGGWVYLGDGALTNLATGEVQAL